MKKIIHKVLNSMGYELIKTKHQHNMEDMEPAFLEMFEQCRPFTMTSVERMYAIYKTVEYIIHNKIDGDIVECGVWKGGSSMLAAISLKHFNNTSKRLYLYDTYEGMSVPGTFDKDLRNDPADTVYRESVQEDGISAWCYSSLDEVKGNMVRTGYPEQNIIYIKGKVEDTIPATIPKEISLLRLDTDWYESTHHNLNHLFPLLKKDGILIFDDYGHWQGARKATDDYFANIKIFPFLSRIDYTGRVYVKH